MKRFRSASADSPSLVYCFGAFRLEADGTLTREGIPAPLPPDELAVLRLLISRAGQVVTNRQLLKAFGNRASITEKDLAGCVASLRARLAPENCVEPVSGRGYRFTAEFRSSAASLHSLPRLAILPFEIGHAIPEYLGSAVAEQTHLRLASLRPAFVSLLPLDSVFTLARHGLSAVEVGRKVNAELVLCGSLRALPDHYRLRAHLTRIADNAELWVEDLMVERNRAGALDAELVSRLALRVGSSTGLFISAAAAPPSTAAHDLDPASREAFDLYLRAHYDWQTFERHRMQDGLQLLLRALELDPSLVAARIDVASSRSRQSSTAGARATSRDGPRRVLLRHERSTCNVSRVR